MQYQTIVFIETSTNFALNWLGYFASKFAFLAEMCHWIRKFLNEQKKEYWCKEKDIIQRFFQVAFYSKRLNDVAIAEKLVNCYFYAE